MTDLKFIDEPAGKIVTKAKGMYSKQREYVPFPEVFEAKGAVESWLSDLELKMRNVLYDQLVLARSTAEAWENNEKEKDNPREFWLDNYCAQLSLVVTLVVWTEEVARAIEDMEGGSETAMKDYLKIIEDRIQKLIARVRGKLDKNLRTKIITIITIDVHGRDIVSDFS